MLWLEKFNEDKIYEYLSYLDKKNIAAMAATIIYICSLLLGLDFYFLLNPSNVFILNVESLGGIGTLDVGVKDDEDVFYSVKNNEHEAIWKKGRDYIYININRRMYRVGFDLSLIM